MAEDQNTKKLDAITKLPQEKVAEKLLAGAYDHDRAEFLQVIQHIINSGYRFSSKDEFKSLQRNITLNIMCTNYCVDWSGWSLAHVFAKYGYAFGIKELITLGNPTNSKNGYTVAHVMAESGNILTFDELMHLDNPKVWDGWTLAHIFAFQGFVFSCDQLSKLGDVRDKDGRTISLWMAEKGHHFNFAELVRLGNPADKDKVTVAHWMARKGFRFSVEELLRLGNPAISDDYHKFMRENREFMLVASDEMWEQVVDNQLASKFGATVAHLMALEGHRFTVEEIKALGNPKDAHGCTLADWMSIEGNPLTHEELEKLS